VDRTVGTPRLAAVALGSNLGDRRAALDFAIARLADLLSGLTVSAAVETDPEDPHGAVILDQPLYLNAVATGLTALDASALLEALLAIEAEYGRERPYPGAPRTLDLDLILLGDVVSPPADAPRLQVPHPRFRERFFVLGPLAEIAPAMRDPVSGRTTADLLRSLLRDESR
jgi:2-amino-4-hydroxy-6-hydroxymethyldihydropteridine diphosphokinase